MNLKPYPVLINAAKYLEVVFNKPTIEKEQDSPYHSLAPTSEAKDVDNYFHALYWALKNKGKENIKNIALTGPFGSGKSSILNTFQKCATDNKLHFLNISLATFKEEIAENDPLKTKGEDLVRLIELSIIQQIFYHERDQEIPDSRFKRIKNYTKWNLAYKTGGLFFLILSILYLSVPDLFSGALNIKVNSVIENLIHFLALISCASGLIIIIWKSIRLINGISISKLNIKDAEIKISEGINKSILNHHLDEILYFFEVTPYNVVIIEDLDRFKQTEIFTKLREINLLINNSKKINKEVVFIYAVRDDMFTDKERTKFFDFIIPVIPVINSSNSNEILSRELKTNKYHISDDLLDDISLFIDDLRLLYNIINEFHIYSQRLNKNLNQDNLLSIIVYKNIYPNDFVKLCDYEGILYETIAKKYRFVIDEISKIDTEILLNKNEIKRIESIRITDINELRALYIFKYIERLVVINEFVINGIPYDFQTVSSDELFPYFINNKVKYNGFFLNNYSSTYGIYSRDISFKFADIEKTINPNYTYSEREELVKNWNNKKAEEFKNKIEELENEKRVIKAWKLKELLTKGHFSLGSDNSKQSQFISILLRNGYINEDYLDYITIFYDVSITKEDHYFLINVKNQIQSEFNYKLNRIEKLIERISLQYFDKSYILNYELIDFILGNDQYIMRQNLIFGHLKNEVALSINFIDGFIDNGTKIDLFIRELCKSWPNIWNYIETRSSFTETKKEKYFKLIIENADNEDIKDISNLSSLRQVILSKNNFLNIIVDKEKLKGIIKTLSIKFVDIDDAYTSKEMLDFIYNKNDYAINLHMLKVLLKFKGNFNQVEFDIKNYFSINNSNCDKLRDYINENINEYVVNVYLKIASNTEEDEKDLIVLLDKNKLSIDNKINIIKQVNTKISEISKIENIETQRIIIKESKVQPTWVNVIGHYVTEKNEISDSLVAFINNLENASTLSKRIIEYEKPDKEIFSKFIKDLLLKEDLQNDSYALILRSIPYSFDFLNFEELSVEKVLLLIRNRNLNLNEAHYDLLKVNFGELRIKLLENYHNEFINKMKLLSLDKDDIVLILKSMIFSSPEKNEIVESLNDETILGNKDVLKNIGNLILLKNSFSVNKSILMSILTKAQLPVKDKLTLFNNKSSLFDINDISEILITLPSPFSDIAKKGKRPFIENNEINRKFIQNLKNKKYISKYDPEKKGFRISTFKN